MRRLVIKLIYFTFGLIFVGTKQNLTWNFESVNFLYVYHMYVWFREEDALFTICSCNIFYWRSIIDLTSAKINVFSWEFRNGSSTNYNTSSCFWMWNHHVSWKRVCETAGYKKKTVPSRRWTNMHHVRDPIKKARLECIAVRCLRFAS